MEIAYVIKILKFNVIQCSEQYNNTFIIPKAHSVCHLPLTGLSWLWFRVVITGEEALRVLLVFARFTNHCLMFHIISFPSRSPLNSLPSHYVKPPDVSSLFLSGIKYLTSQVSIRSQQYVDKHFKYVGWGDHVLLARSCISSHWCKKNPTSAHNIMSGL